MGHFCPNMVTRLPSPLDLLSFYILHYVRDANYDINSFMSVYFQTLTRLNETVYD